MSIPFFVLVLVLTLVALKTHAARPGSTFLGVVLGLALASTALGAPLLDGVTAASEGLVSALASLGRQ